MHSRAILFRAPGEVACAGVTIPDPGPGEVLVETSFSAVSPGTELRCLAGRQVGANQWPYIPGYSLSGCVVAVGDGVDLPVGARVFVIGTTRADATVTWGGHVAHAVCAAGSVCLVDDAVDLVDASVTHLAGIAYRGVRLAAARPHETVAIVGLGPIGMLSAWLHRLTGARVLAGDLSPCRVARARELGLDAFVPEGELAPAFRDRLGHGADVVVDATGVPAVLSHAIPIARDRPWTDIAVPGARLVVQGSYATDVAVPYDPCFRRELSVWFPRDMQRPDAEAVLDLMRRDLFHPRDIVTEVCAPADAAAVYGKLHDANSGLLTVVFRWKGNAGHE